MVLENYINEVTLGMAAVLLDLFGGHLFKFVFIPLVKVITLNKKSYISAAISSFIFILWCVFIINIVQNILEMYITKSNVDFVTLLSFIGLWLIWTYKYQKHM